MEEFKSIVEHPTDLLTQELVKSETKKSFFTKRKALLLSICITVVAVLLVFVGISINNYINHKKLLAEYNLDFQILYNDSNLFKQSVKDGPDAALNFKQAISFYEDLKNKDNFATRLNDLNGNPKYSTLSVNNEKKAFSAFGLMDARTELTDINSNVDKLQGILQKSANVDTEIKILETTTTMTIGDLDKKCDDLITRNSQIKDEVLGVVVHSKLKKYQEIFVQALSMRGDYLSKKKSSNLAYLDALLAKNEIESHFKQGQSYLDTAKTSYFTSTAIMYQNWAKEEGDKAKEALDRYQQKLKQSTDSNNEALESLKSYVALIQADLDVNSFLNHDNKSKGDDGKGVKA